MAEDSSKSPYFGISLSGGGARGIAHLGVLQALKELNISVDKVSGVSAGAIIGALYADDYPPREILKMIQKVKLASFFSFGSLWNRSLLDMEQVETLLRRYLSHNRFEQLEKSLVISATDVNAGQTAYFSSGDLIRPILASACIPLVFKPIEYQGKTLVDGGIICSMEVKPLEDCQKKLGIHTNPFSGGQSLDSTRGLIERCLSLSIHSNARANFQYCDWVIEPSELGKIAAHRVDQAQEIFGIGYRAAMADKERLIEHFQTS